MEREETSLTLFFLPNGSKRRCGNFRCGTPQLKCPQHFFSVSPCLQLARLRRAKRVVNLPFGGVKAVKPERT